MRQSNWSVALDEFIHVGGALVLIIAIVSIITGLIREYIPQEKIQKRLAKHEKRGPLIGALLGTLTPFCSASMVPVVMGMAEMGASMGTVFGFLISAPLCNFVVVGLIFAVFGWKVALAYLAITLLGAIFSGYVIGLTPLRNELKRDVSAPATSCDGASTCSPEPSHSPCECPPEIGIEASLCSVTAPVQPCCKPMQTPPLQTCTSAATPSCVSSSCTSGATTSNTRFAGAISFAWVLFKRITPYVLIGAIISALSAAFLPAEIVERYVGGDNWFAIPVAAVIGVPLYLRIEMAIPLLQVLIGKGMGMGAAMALLIGGTGASLPEIAIISSVLKPKAVAAFVATVLTLAMLGGLAFSALS